MHRKRKYTTLRLLVYHPTVKLLAFIEKKIETRCYFKRFYIFNIAVFWGPTCHCTKISNL